MKQFNPTEQLIAISQQDTWIGASINPIPDIISDE
jgi:hypothetical protein